MAFNELPFEKPINELKKMINEMRSAADAELPSGKAKIARLEKKLSALIESTYKNLSAWDIVMISRHPQRPYAMDYINNIGDNFIELHGDRGFKDDTALIGGLLEVGGIKLMVIGQEKGRGTDEKIYRNFGMAHPEGYRKALRLMKMAEKFKLPVLCLIDTSGAYPGLGAEERGQAEAIARNLREMSVLRTPSVSIVIGEGGSGGALGIGVTDRILMLQYSTYSVISPEGCASILFRDASKAETSAKSLKLTSSDLIHFGIIDRIIEEPIGGAHNNPHEIFASVKSALIEELGALMKLPPNILTKKRFNKFRKMGVYNE